MNFTQLLLPLVPLPQSLELTLHSLTLHRIHRDPIPVYHNEYGMVDLYGCSLFDLSIALHAFRLPLRFLHVQISRILSASSQTA